MINKLLIFMLLAMTMSIVAQDGHNSQNSRNATETGNGKNIIDTETLI